MNRTPLLNRITLLTGLVFVLGATTMLPTTARAATAAEIDRSVRTGLRKLYASSPSARAVGQRAKAVLVFPRIVKGGFIVGAQGGEGALLSGGRTLGYYNTIAASYGLQDITKTSLGIAQVCAIHPPGVLGRKTPPRARYAVDYLAVETSLRSHNPGYAA